MRCCSVILRDAARAGVGAESISGASDESLICGVVAIEPTSIAGVISAGVAGAGAAGVESAAGVLALGGRRLSGRKGLPIFGIGIRVGTGVVGLGWCRGGTHCGARTRRREILRRNRLLLQLGHDYRTIRTRRARRDRQHQQKYG